MRIFSRQGGLAAPKDMFKRHQSYVIFDATRGVGNPEYVADEEIVER